MFDTGDPVLQIQQCDKNTICALTVRGVKRVISILSLPSKLTKSSQGHKIIVGSNDLKIKSGLFTSSDPTKILAIYENDRLLASQKEVKGIIVYNVNFSDAEQLVYERTVDLAIENPEMALFEKDKVVIAKNTSQPAFICDLNNETTQKINISDKENSAIVKPLCINESIIGLTLQSSGTTYLHDCRKPESQIGYIPGDERSSFWTACSSYALHNTSPTSRKIYFLSKSGFFKFYDIRNLSTAVINVQLPLSTTKDCLNIGFNPQNENILSVSGFDENVYLFNVNDISELFRHDGHSRTECCTKETYVTDHFWYSDKYLISSALNNSINCWSPNV